MPEMWLQEPSAESPRNAEHVTTDVLSRVCTADSGRCIRVVSPVLRRIAVVWNHSAPADTILHQVYMYTGPTHECMPREPAHPAGTARLVSPLTGPATPDGTLADSGDTGNVSVGLSPQGRPTTGYSECSKSSIHPSADPVDGFISGTPVPPVSARLAWPCIHQNATGLHTAGPSFSGGHAAVLSSQLPTHHSLSVHQPT